MEQRELKDNIPEEDLEKELKDQVWKKIFRRRLAKWRNIKDCVCLGSGEASNKINN